METTIEKAFDLMNDWLEEVLGTGDGYVHVQWEPRQGEYVNASHWICGKPVFPDLNHGYWNPATGTDVCPHCGKPICPKCYDLALTFSQLRAD